MSHYLKILMDLIFGENNFRSNICWNLSNPYVGAFKWKANNWIYTQNIILYYAKTSNVIFNKKHILIQQKNLAIYLKKPIPRYME